MINQQELDEIVYQELKTFNLSIGWIDPDTCVSYDDFESNDYLLHFKLSDMMYTRIERDTCLEDKSLDLNCNVVLYVEEHEPYEDWVNFQHEFKLPSIHCLKDVETFTECFKKSILCSYNRMRLDGIRDKIRLPNGLTEEQLESMLVANYVDIRFYLDGWDTKVLNIK